MMFRIASAITHFPSLRDSLDINANRHMFVQDVSNGLMPYVRLTREDSGFEAGFDGGIEDVRQAKSLCASISRYSSNSDAEIVSDTVRELASAIAWNGKAYFEISRDNNTRDIRLQHFSARRLIRLPGLYVQSIPRADRKTFQAPRFVILPSSIVWRLQMPGSLGGHRKYRQMLEDLERFDLISPEFWQHAILDEHRMPLVDTSGYRVRANAFARKVTRTWGWNVRDWSQDLNTEYFVFYRFVRRHRAQAVLRDHIKSELNALFKRLGIQASLCFSGLPSVTACDDVLVMMAKGEIGFSEVSQRLSVDEAL